MVLSNPELYAQLDVLKRIHNVARQTAQNLIAYRTAQIPSRLQSSNIPSLTFVPLDTLLNPLSKLDVSEDIQADLKQAFGERITALQEKCIVNYKDACTGAPWLLESSITVDKLRQTYQKFAHRQSVYLVESQLPYLQEEITKYKQNHSTVDAKLTFNHEYTPVLEKYFEYNAYPSLPDRFSLAQKSHMNPRQIEVWFQNHRSRGRKDGVVLKRLSPHEASKINFDELEKKVAPFAVMKRARSTTAETSSSRDTTPEIPTLPLSLLTTSTRPPHAFPTKFSETDFLDPFSRQDGAFKFPSPEWPRRPATHPVTHHQTTIDELCVEFRLSLDLRGASSPKRVAKINKNNPIIEKWFASTVIPKVDAPHPASLRSKYARMPASVPAWHSPHAWQSPTTISRRTYRQSSHFPSWILSTPKTPRRKAPALLHRMPSKFPTYRSNFPPHRTPSLESLASSDSGSSSTTLTGSESRSTSYSESTLLEYELQPRPESQSRTSLSHFTPTASSDSDTTPFAERFTATDLDDLTDSTLAHNFTSLTKIDSSPRSNGVEMPFSLFDIDSMFSIPSFDFLHSEL